LVSNIKEKKLRLRVFKNRMLRKISGPNKKQVTGDLRKLHNEELCDLSSLLNIIQVMT